jgi:uncharacterized phage infection (PIP) family protein YhgE
MNKSVLDKLSKFESNVELAEVKVELGALDDIEKYTSNLSKLFQGANQFYGFVAQAENYAKSQSKEISDAINLTETAINNAEKQARDLGLDLSQNQIILKAKKGIDANKATINIYKKFIERSK